MNTSTHTRVKKSLAVASDVHRGDMGDQSSHISDQEIRRHLIVHDGKESREKFEYLQRKLEGKGEVCKNPDDNPKCLDTISTARREAMPYTTVCKECAEFREELRKRRNR